MLDRDDERFNNFRLLAEDILLNLVNALVRTKLSPEEAFDEAQTALKDLIPPPFRRLPEFDENGWLPAFFQCSVAEFASRFGVSTEHRRALMESLNEVLQLARAADARRLVVFGSFVTAKSSPGDVDAIALMPREFLVRVRSGDPSSHSSRGRDCARTAATASSRPSTCISSVQMRGSGGKSGTLPEAGISRMFRGAWWRSN